MIVETGSLYYSKTRKKWVYDCSVVVGGKRGRQMFYGDTREEVVEFVSRFSPSSVSVDRLGEWLDHWLEVYVKPSVKPRTYNGYCALRKYIPDWLADKKLGEIKPDDIQMFIGRLLVDGGKNGQGLSPKTVREVRRMLITALDSAVENGNMKKNVARSTKPPKLKATEKVALDQEQAKRFIEVARAKDYYWGEYEAQDDGQKFLSDEIAVLVELALNTGMRPGEVCGLRWSRVNAKTCKIKIDATVSEHSVNGRYELGDVKTAASKRTISVSAEIIALLTGLHARQKAYAKFWGSQYENPDGLVFTGIYGKPLDLNNFRKRQWAALCKAAGAPVGFTPHGMRHTFVTLALKAHVDVKAVSTYVGHTDVGFTLKTYHHVLEEVEAEVPVVIEGLLSGE